MSLPTLHLFEGFGVELEYMIVDAETLDVRPICDEVLKAVAGEFVESVDLPGGITWSNELALHLMELKATRPLATLEGAVAGFQRQVQAVNEVLRPFNARLMPTGMHPWMRPDELRLWPHQYSAVYEAFNRIFDCRGHGWSNLQSVHLNLPFCGDEEFGRLHAAIRVLLPLLPALAASSPIVEGRPSGFLDTRLEYYRRNSARIPSIAGLVIPEPVFTRKEYEEQLLQRMYADIAPHDPEGVLCDEFLNARGAIARFSRNAIEIRVLDVQECPLADLSILALIVAVLRELVGESHSTYTMQQRYPTQVLHELLLRTIREGEAAVLPDRRYSRLFGIANCGNVKQLWLALVEQSESLAAEVRPVLGRVLRQGSLARRILDASHEDTKEVYRHLCECLNAGCPFDYVTSLPIAS